MTRDNRLVQHQGKIVHCRQVGAELFQIGVGLRTALMLGDYVG